MGTAQPALADQRQGSVSVAIATLNRPAGLARCLEALLSSVRRPAEIIVVDQGDAEPTRACVARWKDHEVPIVHITQQQRGLSASRNAAISAARCAIVAVTDDDCVPARGWVDEILKTFAGRDAPVGVAGRVLPLGPRVPEMGSLALRESMVRLEFRGPAPPWQVGTGGNFAARREWLERIGGYDQRIGAGSPGRAGEDLDLFYRLLCAGAHLRYEPAMLVYHEQRPAWWRRAQRAGYSHGVGAGVGIWLRHGDAAALAILGRWLLHRARGIAGAARRGDRRQFFELIATLPEFARGIGYGLSLDPAAGPGRATSRGPCNAGGISA